MQSHVTVGRFQYPAKTVQYNQDRNRKIEKIGVLKLDHESEWAAPTFVQPKKTGDVRILTDFRTPNEAICRKPFPLPKISDLLQKLQGFTYATAIDLSMGYYHIPLDDESQNIS
jgi:hypothetical protein